jgi:hypothetical protein
VVFVTPEDVRGSRWLGSELAGHVARYGQWLVGEPDWVQRVTLSCSALERKRNKILHRLRSVEERFSRLDAPYLDKYFVLIRRDLQRHECLANGTPVPPTLELDQGWSRKADTWTELRRLAREARIDSEFLFERLGVPERWPSSGYLASENRDAGSAVPRTRSFRRGPHL